MGYFIQTNQLLTFDYMLGFFRAYASIFEAGDALPQTSTVNPKHY